MITDLRGFTTVGGLTDNRGTKVRVKESSAMGEACCWVFVSNPAWKDAAPHLNASQARELAAMLNQFADWSESDECWRNQ